MIEYDSKRNEVRTKLPFEKRTISGDPSDYRIVWYCKLIRESIIFNVPPDDCPLRDPNFKLTRIF